MELSVFLGLTGSQSRLLPRKDIETNRLSSRLPERDPLVHSGGWRRSRMRKVSSPITIECQNPGTAPAASSSRIAETLPAEPRLTTASGIRLHLQLHSQARGIKEIFRSCLGCRFAVAKYISFQGIRGAMVEGKPPSLRQEPGRLTPSVKSTPDKRPTYREMCRTRAGPVQALACGQGCAVCCVPEFRDTPSLPPP